MPCCYFWPVTSIKSQKLLRHPVTRSLPYRNEYGKAIDMIISLLFKNKFALAHPLKSPPDGGRIGMQTEDGREEGYFSPVSSLRCAFECTPLILVPHASPSPHLLLCCCILADDAKSVKFRTVKIKCSSYLSSLVLVIYICTNRR